MKLAQALRLAKEPQQGPPFCALLACSFTPLHLETALRAHFRLALPGRTIEVRTGLYGDIAGTLEGASETRDVALVTIEWADLDPRLGWRSMAPIDEAVLGDAKARLDRISAAITSVARKSPVVLALPGLPIAPVFHTPSAELHLIESHLREMIYGFASSSPAAVLSPDSLPYPRHDLRTELLNGFPYLFPYTDALAAGLVQLALPPPARKGLITDLDETVWSGVLGDDGPDGISWDLDHKTQFHALYQHMLNSLGSSGTLIGVASKNDQALVEEAFKRPDLVLNPQHLFPIEAHWRSKTESILRTLDVWNIAADSVVFVDDNPIELEQAQTAFPGMECVLFCKDDAQFLFNLRNYFGKRTIRDEDTLRTSSLRAGQVLRSAEEDGTALDQLLKGAQAKILFRWGKQPPDPRALELINKTNQFNLNGVRYTEADWWSLLSDPAARVMVADYEDRFGRLGKIAVLAGREQGGAFYVESWVMSCRAFSRRIEHQCLKQMLEHWEPVIFCFKQTERNGPLQDFFRQIGVESSTITRAEFQRRCPPLFHETESMSV